MNQTSPSTGEPLENGQKAAGAVSRPMPPLVEETRFYTIEGEEYVQEEAPSAEYVVPFQISGDMPYVAASPSQGAQANGSPSVTRRWHDNGTFPIKRVLALSIAVLIVGSLFAVSVFAQQAMPPQQKGGNVSLVAPQATATLPKAVPTPQHRKGIPPTPTVGATPQAMLQVNGVPTNQFLQQLGWITAGLTIEDAIQVDRTAATFVDREEDLVYNKAGTRTAATFLLTPAARNRFAQNDVRVSSNTLWNTVTDPRRQYIQLAVNEQPTLVKQVARGQNQFAWVDVQFELWQSQVDPQNPNQRIGGLENDPVTNRPRIHHLIVLLVQVAPGSQGINAPMGGTGWLVSNYALNPAAGALPAIVSPA